ncbi:invertase inhibitor [Olea europaea subsp. europaea]|uniref:Invertase inhibitor n=1 Tax=Olea europaea subsp. europaea TaxID=158383 RepID=A0A8S0RUR3_OLEEU|nr:invertase inhibitor [Olea europaea subsp. europaea]CAA2983134.1 invertase inhibitor [Olea europaea subsp. europaea]
MSPFFSFILPTLFLSFLISTHPVNGQNLVNETCKKIARRDPNIEYNFCTTSLQAAPTSQCASLQRLGMISIKLVRHNVTDTRVYVKHLMKNGKLDPYSKLYLKDCYELFSDAISSVKRAMKYYNSKRYDDANMQKSGVMDAATTCEDGFSEREGLVSPLTKRNRNTFQLSAIVLSIMHEIKKGSNV